MSAPQKCASQGRSPDARSLPPRSRLQWGNDSVAGPYLNLCPDNAMLNASETYDKNNNNGMSTFIANNSTRIQWAELQLNFNSLKYHGFDYTFEARKISLRSRCQRTAPSNLGNSRSLKLVAVDMSIVCDYTKGDELEKTAMSTLTMQTSSNDCAIPLQEMLTLISATARLLPHH